MNHYYTNNEDTLSNIIYFEYTYKGNKLKFKSDNGVFSKKRVDYGTNLLVNIIDEELKDLFVLDVGCGIGVIGLLLAKTYKTSIVHMIDVNDRAIALAKSNAIDNNISNVIIYKSNVYENVNELFDVIVSNPPIRAGKSIVHQIVKEAYEKLKDKGFCYIVIQKKQGAESLKTKMIEVFDDVKVILKKDGYYVIKGIKGISN